MSWQVIAVIVIIALAVIYGVRRFYKTVKHGGCGCSPAQQANGAPVENNACAGCSGCKSKK